jgi:hypothetical protein
LIIGTASRAGTKNGCALQRRLSRQYFSFDGGTKTKMPGSPYPTFSFSTRMICAPFVSYKLAEDRLNDDIIAGSEWIPWIDEGEFVCCSTAADNTATRFFSLDGDCAFWGAIIHAAAITMMIGITAIFPVRIASSDSNFPEMKIVETQVPTLRK